jgi:2-C-methyl-D-erythritol 2,4-cyclodiphosphate synthase
LGHSDADVLLHAICDALLGAVALGDIGQHFPDSDSQYQDINSLLLLKEVAGILQRTGWRVINVDSTVVAQEPRLAPHIKQMRQNIARFLAIETEKVSVKATTTEGLGFEGSQQGISAHAVVLIEQA